MLLDDRRIVKKLSCDTASDNRLRLAAGGDASLRHGRDSHANLSPAISWLKPR
jgi:hypothetical protein